MRRTNLVPRANGSSTKYQNRRNTPMSTSEKTIQTGYDYAKELYAA